MAGDQLCGTVGAKGGRKTANPWPPLKPVEIHAKINVSGWAKTATDYSYQKTMENHWEKPMLSCVTIGRSTFGWAKDINRLQLSENHRKPLGKQRFRGVGRKH